MLLASPPHRTLSADGRHSTGLSHAATRLERAATTDGTGTTSRTGPQSARPGHQSSPSRPGASAVPTRWGLALASGLAPYRGTFHITGGTGRLKHMTRDDGYDLCPPDTAANSLHDVGIRVWRPVATLPVRSAMSSPWRTRPKADGLGSRSAGAGLIPRPRRMGWGRSRVRWSGAGTLSIAGRRSRRCDSYQRA